MVHLGGRGIPQGGFALPRPYRIFAIRCSGQGMPCPLHRYDTQVQLRRTRLR
jgi:hypothetical protein